MSYPFCCIWWVIFPVHFRAFHYPVFILASICIYSSFSCPLSKKSDTCTRIPSLLYFVLPGPHASLLSNLSRPFSSCLSLLTPSLQPPIPYHVPSPQGPSHHSHILPELPGCGWLAGCLTERDPYLGLSVIIYLLGWSFYSLLWYPSLDLGWWQPGWCVLMARLEV